MTFLQLFQWFGVTLGGVGAATLALGAWALPDVDDALADHERRP
jgi:hypothetical protein